MRTDLELIYDWVPQGAHVLDLACGDGILLERLAQEKGVTGYGLEIDPDGITQCVARGVNVIEHNLDDGLGRQTYSRCCVTLELVVALSYFCPRSTNACGQTTA